MYHRQKVEKKSQPRGSNWNFYFTLDWKDDDVNPNPDDYRLKQTTPGFNRNTFTAISSDSVPTTTYSQDNPSNLYRPPHSHQETAPYKKSTYNMLE